MVSKLIDSLLNLGVEDFVSCPGGRSAALLNEILKRKKEKNSKINIETLYDERSAGFYALGKSLRTKKPVVVLTTSGSAVAALYPALLEAQYQEGARLIALTADRPEELSGSGAPQTIVQKNIFSQNKITSFQYAEDCDFTGMAYPVHINAPLKDPNPSKERPNAIKYDSLVLISSLREDERDEVKRFLVNYEGPLVLEPLSNLSEEYFPKAQIIKYADDFVSKIGLNSFKEVCRIGGVPVLKSWRDSDKHDAVYFWNRYNYQGTLSAKAISLEEIAKKLIDVRPNQDLEVKITEHSESVECFISESPLSEVSQILSLSKIIPEGSNVFLGNSMPIREWAFVDWSKFNNSGQRGVNGIDGSVALALGALSKDKENWLILGDLTTLYNLNDFQILKYLKNYEIRIVVVNNSGGRIFEKIFKENKKYFINEQAVSFKKVADLWGLDYVEFGEDQKFSDQVLIELKVDPAESLKFWGLLDKRVDKIMEKTEA